MRRPTLPALLLALAAAGCGNQATRPPDVARPDDPQGARDVDLPAAGVRFRAPANWIDLPAQAARAGGVRSKRATVAVWRYERAEPLPRDRAALRAAGRRLLERIRTRDPRFDLRSTSYRRRAGARTIELVGTETIAGRPRAVRSAHLFAAGAEIVVDAYAPPEDFAGLDAGVFRPLLRSLALSPR